MATVKNRTDRLLGFTNDSFELVIKKPKADSVWVESELKVGESTIVAEWKENEAPEMLAGRMKSTLEKFLKSSFDGFVIVGKVVKDKK